MKRTDAAAEIALPKDLHTNTTDTVSTIAFEAIRNRCDSQMDLTVCSGCDACGLRCAAGVPASRVEWDMLQQYVAELDSAARTDLARVEAQDKTMDLGDGVTVQMCRYRDMNGGRCAVYPARPLVCRLLGHVEWMPCPIEKVTRIVRTSDALELMKAYSATDRRTFEQWEQIDSCGARGEREEAVKPAR